MSSPIYIDWQERGRRDIELMAARERRRYRQQERAEARALADVKFNDEAYLDAISESDPEHVAAEAARLRATEQQRADAAFLSHLADEVDDDLDEDY